MPTIPSCSRPMRFSLLLAAAYTFRPAEGFCQNVVTLGFLDALSRGPIPSSAGTRTRATHKRFVPSMSTTTDGGEGSRSSPIDSLVGIFRGKGDGGNRRIASDLVKSLVVEDQCYTTVDGAEKFGAVCAPGVVYEDCYESRPIVGKAAVTEHMLAKVASRNGKGGLRLDRISDGSRAAGFAWTYTCNEMEGLRGTTFVELNNAGEIGYVREIPEPIFKPGDLTVKLLEAVTKGAEPKRPVSYEKKTPIVASEVAAYLFREVQGSSIDESMRFFDERIVYRDFNFDELLTGKDEVRRFIEDFSFPGITFRMQRIDDGVQSTSFTWEVVLDGVEDTTRGISLYELNPETKLIDYVRDVPESAIKPPPLGKLARLLNPGLGVFKPVTLGSREGGK